MNERNADLCKYCIECVKPCPYGFYNDDICELTEEQCRKRQFVREHLMPLVRASACDILDVTYEAKPGCGEWVVLKYRGGYTEKENVSGDSLIALVRDAIKNI